MYALYVVAVMVCVCAYACEERIESFSLQNVSMDSLISGSDREPIQNSLKVLRSRVDAVTTIPEEVAEDGEVVYNLGAVLDNSVRDCIQFIKNRPSIEIIEFI
jgi:hypothetical protein